MYGNRALRILLSGFSYLYILVKDKIRRIMPTKNKPNPRNKAIVLIGWPNLVIHAKAFKSKPEIITPITTIILLFFVNSISLSIKIFVFYRRSL